MSGVGLMLSVDDGVARLALDLPGEPVNKITRDLRKALDDALTEIAHDRSVLGAVLISDKPGSFIAGADIDEFVALTSQEEALALVRSGQTLINRLDSVGKPIVAAIGGTCLGGGLEAAMACAYRIATTSSKTTLGLPEVQLGIIPAAGGCQRLPRLVGLAASLDLILTGRSIAAKKAHRLGLVDELVHPAILEQVAVEAVRRLAGGWKPSRESALRTLAWNNPAARAVVLNTAKRRVEKKAGSDYPAPLMALDAVGHGLRHGIPAGLRREAEYFAELAVGEVSRNLVTIFFATNALKKDPVVVADGTQPRRVNNLCIVGAGFMGSGIGATAINKGGVDVRFRDADLPRVQAGLNRVRGSLHDRLKKRRMTRFEHRRAIGLLSGGSDWHGFQRADLVIEAVFEDLQVKHEVFQALEKQTAPECVLASNTSTIPITEIARVLEDPSRALGMHFFSPVEKMPLLEVIATDLTASWAIVTAARFGRSIGKTVVVVRDRPGFWVNRILSPYLNEAVRLVIEGVPIDEIDGAMKRFGFPVGPITLLDEVGLDVAHKGSRVLHAAFGERLTPPDGLARLIDDGRLGRKNGRGFYSYDDEGKRSGVDESVYGVMGIDARPVPEQDIENRLVFAMLNEVALAESEGVVQSPRDGDVGAVYGIGFPPFRGGPFRYIDTLGAGRVVDSLERLQHAYGARFEPAEPLHAHTSSDRPYYQ